MVMMILLLLPFTTTTTTMLIFFFHAAEAQQSPDDSVTNFTPSLGIVLGILSIIFALTFTLLVYLKFCYISGASDVHDNDQENRPGPGLGLLRSGCSRFSGIDKNVVDSLPFFRFSSLKGSREGLECAVCLLKFEDVEILRLLPKCKHGFHIDCIDEWLGQHSTCPLCRQRVTPDDLNNFLSSSLRWPSSTAEPGEAELFVERERDIDHAGLNSSSSRFSIGGSFRKMKEKCRRNQEHDDENQQQVFLHRVNHRITTVSDLFILKNRWSNVSSSDLLFLNKEMLRSMSSNRFSSVKTETESNQLGLLTNVSSHTSRILILDGQRSRSEIAVHPRESSSLPPESGSVGREERIRMTWLPIARTTLRWFANREKFQARV